MSNPYFRFQQFTVWHDKCAMKVGTDGVLLGAWAQVEGCQRILDVGTGTGLIALMVAQRNALAGIDAIDVEENAVVQARENVQKSPFAERIVVSLSDVRELSGQYDCIVCNPPFYTEDTQSPLAERSLARNANNLSFSDLAQAVDSLLAEGGVFNVIVPYSAYKQFASEMMEVGMHVQRKCLIKTTERKQPKRVLASFFRGQKGQCAEELLVLQGHDGERTEQYNRMTKDFYLMPSELIK